MNKQFFFAVIATAMLFTSCKKKEETPETPGGKGKYLVQMNVVNPDGASGTSYIQLVQEISGDINNSKALQIDFASAIVVEGNEVFSFPTMGKDATMAIRKFTYNPNNQTFSTPSKLNLKAPTAPMNITFITPEKAYVPQYISGNVMIMNPKTMKETGEINLKKYAHNDPSCEPAFGIVRGNYYYLPLNQINAQFMPYADYNQVDVAVIDIKTDKVVKVISEKESGLCFPTRPMCKNMIFKDEQKDIWITCTGHFGLVPNKKKNGFVCIPADKIELDATRSWDISNTPIEGIEYKSSSVLNTLYLGDGKVAGFVAISELIKGNPYMAKYNMPVIFDLKAKTIKAIKEIPLTNGHAVHVSLHNGLVIFGIDGEKKAGFFSYNPSSGEVKHLATTAGSPWFLHEFK